MCFSEIDGLPSLATLRLTFRRFEKIDPQRVTGPMSWQSRVQRSLFKAVTWDQRCESSVTNLILENVLAFRDDDDSTSELFRGYMGTISNLSISAVISTIVPSSDYRNSFREFWAFTIPNQFLSPAQSTLTSLTLHSDELVGVGNYHIECPHLEFMSLSRLVFVFQAADEVDFISRQRCLTRIELRSCIVLHQFTSAVLWSHIWKRIGENLKSLEYLEVDFAQNPYIHVPGHPNGGETDGVLQEDETSLQTLQAALHSRRASRIV